MFKIILLILLAAAAWAILSTLKTLKRYSSEQSPSISTQDERISDVTTRIENLGMPFNKPGYARNVWDLQVFNHRIYLGHGNAANTGPDPNAGPVPVIYYDTDLGSFINEYTVDEEEIESFRIIDGKLYIPGFDPTESWDHGNFYRLENDHWIKMRTIPGGVHNFDMAAFNGKLYAGLGTTSESPTVYMSGDAGSTWKPVTVSSGDPYYALIGRTYNLINFGNSLYAVPLLLNMSNYEPNNRIMIITPTQCYTQKIYKDSMFPGAKLNIYRLCRAVVALNNIIYFSGIYDSWTPEGLYYAPALNRAKRIVLPETGVVPADILARETAAYVLVYKKIAANLYTNIVYKTVDLSWWTEVFRFQYDTFARSFEEIDGNFYLGMGCNKDYISPSTGTILRVKANAYGP